MALQKEHPVVVDATAPKEKKPRQVLDILAILISIFALFVPYYLSEIHVSEDLKATILGIEPTSDTNGFYTVTVSLMFRSEGNRQIVIPRSMLVLSETPSFDLEVLHMWDRSSPIVVGPKQSTYETVVFGEGHHRFQMIETRRPDRLVKEFELEAGKPQGKSEEPSIFGKLEIDVMDSKGRIHAERIDIGTLRRGQGLRLSLPFNLPYDLSLLPSSASPPVESFSQKPNQTWTHPKLNPNSGLEFGGPIGARLRGVYTNDYDKGWPEQLPDLEHGYTYTVSAIIMEGGKTQQFYEMQYFRRGSQTEIQRISTKDGTHEASVIWSTNGVAVALDGKNGPKFEGIAVESLLFSSDGKHLAYIAGRKDKQVMVLDEAEGPEFDAVGKGNFSSNCLHFAYAGLSRGKSHMVFDGRQGPPFDQVGKDCVFSSDGLHVAYLALNGKKAALVVDGLPGPALDGVALESVRFSGDGRHVAYVGSNNRDQFMIFDGKLGPKFPHIGNQITLSRDGKHIAYVGIDGSNQMAVVDGKVGAPFAGIMAIPFVFSDDGRRVAFTAMIGKKQAAVVDGVVGPEFDSVAGNSIVFSPDGKHFAYGATTGGRWFVVYDGLVGSPFDGIVRDSFVFKADGALEYKAPGSNVIYTITQSSQPGEHSSGPTR
jgi:roadblock/LC7 domain-containing protein